MRLLHGVVVRAQSPHGYRRITRVVIRSARKEGGRKYGAYWMSEVLNHLEMMLVALIV